MRRILLSTCATSCRNALQQPTWTAASRSFVLISEVSRWSDILASMNWNMHWVGIKIITSDGAFFLGEGILTSCFFDYFVAIVADHADALVEFNAAASLPFGGPSSSISSLVDQETDLDPLDFTVYMDQVRNCSSVETFRLVFAASSIYVSRISPCICASLTQYILANLPMKIWQAPLTVQTNSPLELVQQLFAKLGARYVIVTDPNGFCECSVVTFIISLTTSFFSVILHKMP